MLISYAQNLEDVMLWRAVGHIEAGRYIDIGAQHPVVDSVSKAFYDRGWRGLHVEPVPYYSKLLQEHRPDEQVLAAAAGRAGVLAFFEFPDTGLSTLDPSIAQRHQQSGFRCVQTSVPVVTLEAILAQASGGGDVHWMKIDVEGAEREVLESWGDSPVRPWILVIESTLPLSSVQVHQEWESIVLGKGYRFVYFDGLNRFYVSSEHLELAGSFHAPPNVFDDFVLAADAQQPMARSLRDELTAERTSRSELEAALQHQQAERSELEVALQRQQARLSELEAALQHQQTERSELEATLQRQQARLSELEAVLRLQHGGRSELESALQQQRAYAAELENRLDALYTSTSWRLTAPMRQLKEMVMRGWYRFAPARLQRINAHREPPNSSRSSRSVDPEDFELIRLSELDLYFSKGPLADSRGIGRVAHALLAGFRRLEGEQGERKAVVPKVHFYASIHWCPEEPPVPTVVMVHDVIPLLFQDAFPISIVQEWKLRYSRIARSASRVVTISASSARDVSSCLGIPEHRLSVVANGVTPLPDGTPAVEVMSVPYFVYLGAFDHHKNLDVVLQALGDDRCRSFHLVMIGDNMSSRERVRALGLDARVHYCGRMPDVDVRYMLQGAVAMVFPSLYEGFGLPPLEAALLGVPAICSRRPAMTETLEGAALFAEPDDPGQWADAMLRIGTDPELREWLADKAKARAKTFTWDRAVRELYDVLRQEARGS